MKLVEGAKYHGYGNDFVIIPWDQVETGQLSDFARRICDRHFGIGADGCIFLTLESPFTLRIFNRDGSESGMSGNGARCASAYLHHQGRAGERIELETQSGRKLFRLLKAGPPLWTFDSDMGHPSFDARSIPFHPPHLDAVKDYPLEVGGEELELTVVNVGNPQCVVFSDTLPGDSRFKHLGFLLERHPAFPERTNVSFAQVVDRHHLKVRIWERGVGPTHSSGTGCTGAAVASIWTGRADSPVQVETATGIQVIDWQPDGSISLTGDAGFIADFKFGWSP
ncbi:MAG TPA: diaminopimelate epimerase [Acidobacteriota bacterium]|nr:diaminopimelate epimerase [Acidobacteriota bacterium]